MPVGLRGAGPGPGVVSTYTLLALQQDNGLTRCEQAATATGASRSRSHGHRSTESTTSTASSESDLNPPDAGYFINRLLARCDNDRRRAEEAEREERRRADEAEKRRVEEIRRQDEEEKHRKLVEAAIAELGFTPLCLDML